MEKVSIFLSETLILGRSIIHSYCEVNHYKLGKSRPILFLTCFEMFLLYEIRIWRYVMTKQQTKAQNKPLGKLANCRVIETGIGDFAECAQWGPIPCDHALPFGYCFLCMHPRVDELIENTKKQQPYPQVTH